MTDEGARSLLARSSIISAPAAAEAAFQPRAVSFVRIESCRMRDERAPSAHARTSNPWVGSRDAGGLIAASNRPIVSSSTAAASRSPGGSSARRSIDASTGRSA